MEVSFRSVSLHNQLNRVSVPPGRPPPNVTWYLDNGIIDASYEYRADGVTVNHLLFPNVGRQHLNSRLICMAGNTNLSPPTSKVVILDVYRESPIELLVLIRR